MPSPSVFRIVADALCEAVDPSAVIVGVEVSSDASYITVWTSNPVAVVGRHGASALKVRSHLEQAVGHHLTFRVELAEGIVGEDPIDGPAEDRSSMVRSFETTKQEKYPPPLPRIPRP
jgi:hypothetical protein